MAKKSKKKSSSSSHRAVAVSVEPVAAVGASSAYPVGVVPVKPQLNPFCIEPTTTTSQETTWQGDYDWRNGHRTAAADYEDDYYDDEEDEYTQQARGLLPSHGGGDDEYWNASPNRRSTTAFRRSNHSHLSDNSWRIRACALCLVLPLIVWMAWLGTAWKPSSSASSSSEWPSSTPQGSPIATPTAINSPKRRDPDPPSPPPNAAKAVPTSSPVTTIGQQPTRRSHWTSSPSQLSGSSTTTTNSSPRPVTASPLATGRPVVVVVVAAPTKTPQNVIETDDDDDDADTASSGSQEDKDDDDDDEKKDDLDTPLNHDHSAAAAVPAPDSLSRRPTKPVQRLVLLGERHSGVEWWQSTLQRCFPDDATTIVAGLEPRRRGPYWFQTSVAADRTSTGGTITPSSSIPVRVGDVIVVAVRNPYHWVELMWQHPRYAPNHSNEDPQYPLPLRKFLAQPWSLNATALDVTTTMVRSGKEKCQLGFTPQQVTPCLSMPSLMLPLNDTVPVYELDEQGRVFANILQLRAAKIRHWLDEINAALRERNKDPNHRRIASPQRGVLLLLPYESGLTNATLQALQTLVGRPSSCRVNDTALPPSTNLLNDASLDSWRSKQVHGAKYKKFMLEHVNWHEEGRIGYYPEPKE
jgi:hypothetical protein